MKTELLIRKLKDCDLRVTPQRMLVLQSISETSVHPTAEEVFMDVKKKLPNIAVGTVYNILETFVEKKLVDKISSRGDKMRYDLISEDHHHLLSNNSETIKDYYNEELTGIIGKYLEKNKIPGFAVSGFMLNISGEFNKDRNN